MEENKPLIFFLSLILFCHTLPQCFGQPQLPSADGDDGDRQKLQIYIVHVEKPMHVVFSSHEDRKDWHKSFLPSLTLDSGEPRMVYSYKHAIGGFAARLTADEVEAMAGINGFLSAQPNEELQPRTTHTSKFLGLSCSECLWRQTCSADCPWQLTNKSAGMIIGVLDRGFFYDHPSFSGRGMPPMPVPPRWNGGCLRVEDCNNKIIGTSEFNATGVPYDPARDLHGTACASVAAGNFVEGASDRGFACGTAAGAAPLAHLSLYTAVWLVDWLSAVDLAIDDGIDVLSISIGHTVAYPFHRDNMAIATLKAVRNGIFVSVAAGNEGPDRGTILDNEPWTLSVGASTTDRVVRVNLKLGDGTRIQGESTLPHYLLPPTGAVFPAVFPGGLTGSSSDELCEDRSFGGVAVSGKIVLCLRDKNGGFPNLKSYTVEKAGGKGVVFMNTDVLGNSISYSSIGFPVIPVVFLTYIESQRLKGYIMKDPNPTITMEPVGTVVGVPRNPAVWLKSSRGPSPVNNGVLKPDILGPGANVLVAANPSQRVPFKFVEGTSVAAPHLAAIAAMLRSSHPDWSPAMVKSAIMTTADRLDNTGSPIANHTGKPADLFATGAGQVNARRADDPGLVYDIDVDVDYLKYVCGLGYTDKEVNKVIGEQVDCNAIGEISGEELNYPTFSVSLSSTGDRKSVNRTATNVGPVHDSYTLSLVPPAGVTVDVSPSNLHFVAARRNQTYTVTFEVANTGRLRGETAEGQLTWISYSHQHIVRSPISVTFS